MFPVVSRVCGPIVNSFCPNVRTILASVLVSKRIFSLVSLSANEDTCPSDSSQYLGTRRVKPPPELMVVAKGTVIPSGGISGMKHNRENKNAISLEKESVSAQLNQRFPVCRISR